MRFGTKILLLTLAITTGLGAMIVVAVRSEITERETTRALADIKSATDRYFERLDIIQERVSLVVHREMDDPGNKARLDSFSSQASPVDREEAQGQFDGFLFGLVLQQILKVGESIAPAFQVLLDTSARPAVVTAVDNEPLRGALQTEAIAWPVQQVLRADRPSRAYLLIGGKLYLAFGIPIRQTRGEDPNFAYFAGFAITDEWVRQLLGREGGLSMASWFIVDNQVVASASDPAGADRVWQALLRQANNNPPGSGRRTVTFEVEGEPFVGEHVGFEPASNVKGVLALASSLDQALLPLRRLRREIGFYTLFSMLLAATAARWMSRRLARPVEQLVEGASRIGKGDFTTSIPVTRRDELGTLARSFNDMAAGLKQRDLIKDTLGQFVDPRIADALITHPESLRGQRVVQSVLFSDLEKFTTLSERLDPESLVQLLNRYLGASADIVKSLNGYLDKFTGDGVVAFWGPPVETNHSLAACRAALRMVELSKQFTDPPLRVRIGITTGEVLVGIVGSESSKKNYTAMGDVVNLASRLEGANKVYGTQILVDARTAREVEGNLATRLIDVVRVVGRGEPVELYEVLGDASSSDGRYDQAMIPYRARRWAEARDAFHQLDDGPSQVMTQRCRQFLETSPDADWDGIWNLEAK